jgi:hypothetical protein
LKQMKGMLDEREREEGREGGGKEQD